MGSNGTRFPPLPAATTLPPAAPDHDHPWVPRPSSALGGNTQWPATWLITRELIVISFSLQNLLICFQQHATCFRTGESICTRGCAEHRLLLASLDQLNIQAQRLQLANQHVERFGHARLHGSFAFNDGLINLGAAINVIGLSR